MSKPVTYGSEVQLKHRSTNVFLFSCAAKYNHPKSSRQQCVGGVLRSSPETIWRVKPAHGADEEEFRGRPVSNGDKVRLEHVATRTYLHSHSDHPSPVHGQQEVTAYGIEEPGDTNDNWVVNTVDGEREWSFDAPVKLVHETTNVTLHSHGGDFQIAGRIVQEVTGYKKRDQNDLWSALEEAPREDDSDPVDPDSESSRNRTTGGKQKLLRINKILTIVVSVAAAIMSAGSALFKLLVAEIPTFQPVVLVLVTFFIFLVIAGFTQLYLYVKSLKSADEKTQFVHKLAYGTFLFVVMVGGMFARYFWELFQSGKGIADANLTTLLLPLLVSLMVFYPLWTMVADAPKNFFSVVAAFQNGFFWQTIFSGLKPFTGA